jgi:hypothetical protein
MTEDIKKRKSFKNLKQYPEVLDKLKTLFESDISSRSGKKLSASTISNYVGKINRLSILCKGHGFDGDLEWLLDADKVVKEINDSDLTSKKDYISGVVKLLKFKNVSEEIIKKYLSGMTTFKTAEYSLRKDNMATTKQVEDSLPLKEIISKLEAYKPEDEMGVVNKLICSLYFLNSFVPRRGDLTLLKYVSTSKKPKDMAKTLNYITVDKNGFPVDLIMNHYKSRSKYGDCIRFNLTPEVRKIFKTYMDMTNAKNGDYCFLSNSKDTQGNQKPFTVQNWSDVITDATKAIFGKPLTSNLMRKIMITDFYRSGLKSINEQEAFAKKFLHSSAMGREYVGLNLKTDGDDDE